MRWPTHRAMSFAAPPGGSDAAFGKLLERAPLVICSREEYTNRPENNSNANYSGQQMASEL